MFVSLPKLTANNNRNRRNNRQTCWRVFWFARPVRERAGWRQSGKQPVVYTTDRSGEGWLRSTQGTRQKRMSTLGWNCRGQPPLACFSSLFCLKLTVALFLLLPLLFKMPMPYWSWVYFNFFLILLIWVVLVLPRILYPNTGDLCPSPVPQPWQQALQTPDGKGEAIRKVTQSILPTWLYQGVY